MAGYAGRYSDERDAHDVTRRQLARSNERLEDIFSFIRDRGMTTEFMEWVLKRDLGKTSTDTGSMT